MLAPVRVKWRKQQKGKMRGVSKGGTSVSFGEFGLQAMTCGFVTARQIEAARTAISRHVKRGGKLYVRIFPTSPSRRSRLKPAWERAKAPQRNGSQSFALGEFCTNLKEYPPNSRSRLFISRSTSCRCKRE